MRRNVYLLFLCVAMLMPSVATAHFFARQKVVVWEIGDRNNDVSLDPATKQQIHTSFIDAFVGSRNYEAVEVNIDDVTATLKARGLSRSPGNIAKIVREKSGANYVIFTNIKILQRSNSYDDYMVQISSEFFSTETLKSERMAYVDMKSETRLIPGACTQLLSQLLQEPLEGSSGGYAPQYSAVQQPSYQSSYQPSNQQPTYQSSYQPAYAQTPQNYVEDANCGLNMKMVYVEGGTFQMGATSEQGGDADSDERPVHSVTLSGYYIAECEVTQAQWEKIMGTTISAQRNKADSSYSLRGVGDNYPMYFVSWVKAQEFCGRLSELTGKTYFLPSEAQWEYAARGGNKSKGYKWSGYNYVDLVAWYDSNSGSSTHPVKQKRPNELGLYDMSGNVWEWCCDWYGAYNSSSQTDPTGASSGSYRVLRGGSWRSSAQGCRVSNRDKGSASYRYDFSGFRVVCLP